MSIAIDLSLSPIQLQTLLRHMRRHRDEIAAERRRLELRADGIGDGLTQNAIRTLDNELFLLEEVIAELWKVYQAKFPQETQ